MAVCSAHGYAGSIASPGGGHCPTGYAARARARRRRCRHPLHHRRRRCCSRHRQHRRYSIAGLPRCRRRRCGSSDSGGSNNDGVLHAVSLVEQTGDVGNGGTLLADGDVDAVEGLGVVTSLEDGLLVKDGINGDGGLAGLSVTNDKLTLASANGHLKYDRPLTTATFYNIYLSEKKQRRVVVSMLLAR